MKSPRESRPMRWEDLETYDTTDEDITYGDIWWANFPFDEKHSNGDSIKGKLRPVLVIDKIQDIERNILVVKATSNDTVARDEDIRYIGNIRFDCRRVANIKAKHFCEKIGNVLTKEHVNEYLSVKLTARDISRKGELIINTGEQALLTIQESGWVIPKRDKKYNTYEHSSSVFESLTDQEKEWVAPHGYKDVPCYYREVAYNKSKTLPVGFVDIYRVSQKGIDNPGENVAKIILAVRKDYRKQGLAKALIKDAVHRFKDSDIDVLRYNVVDGNDASKELAIKCGFIYNFHSDKHKVTSFMITNGRKMQEAIGEESNDIYFEEEPETDITSIAEEVESMIQELSGGGPMIGMEINDQSVTTYNPGMFIISYGSKKDANPNDDIATSSGYAVANDLRSKYILVKRKNKVVREDYVEFLTDRKISIYEYTGDVSKWYEMLKSIDEGKSNGEFYTALTGRELLTDDQIYFDEHFKYYNPFKVKIENGMTLDLNKEYSLVEGREFLLPVMDDEMLKLQERVNNINPNYTIKEGPKGYFIVSEAEGKCSALPLSKHDIEEYVR